jgi:hypothetical protein
MKRVFFILMALVGSIVYGYKNPIMEFIGLAQHKNNQYKINPQFFHYDCLEIDGCWTYD